MPGTNNNGYLNPDEDNNNVVANNGATPVDNTNTSTTPGTATPGTTTTGTDGNVGTGGDGNAAPAPVKPAAPAAQDWYQTLMKEVEGNVETEEQRKQRAKREARRATVNSIADAVRALGNMQATIGYAPNGYDDTKSMSAQYRARMEKAKAARDADRARVHQEAMQKIGLQRQNYTDAWNKYLSDMQQYNNDRNYAWQEKETQRQQSNFDRQFEQNQSNIDRQFNYTKERNDKLDAQQQEQFKMNYNLQLRQVNMAAKSDVREFTLGNSEGNITLPKSKSNIQNISFIFHKLPQDVQDKAQELTRTQTTDRLGMPSTTSRRDLTADEMHAAIGAYLATEGDTDNGRRVRNAIREVANVKQKNYRNNDNTPPSRRR